MRILPFKLGPKIGQNNPKTRRTLKLKTLSKLHLANTHFEQELSSRGAFSLEKAAARHPIFAQLQFLPFLYGAAGDGVAVTELPDPEFLEKRENSPKLHLLSEKGPLPYQTVDSWGASLAVARFAKEHQLSYVIPDWEVVREVNSKAFSFAKSPKLPGAALLYTEKEVQQWQESLGGPKVLKSCFGVSGQGHLFLDKSSPLQLSRFLHKVGLPVIAEPWVPRLLDFSTQWMLLEAGKIEYIGATLCENSALGRYVANRVGDEKELFGENLCFLKEHSAVARELLSKMAELGYFGHVGFDAMLYEEAGKKKLHPIVEINARKTMGWVALQLQRRFYPSAQISCSFRPSLEEGGLLPKALIHADGSRRIFSRNLFAIKASNS